MVGRKHSGRWIDFKKKKNLLLESNSVNEQEENNLAMLT